MASAGLRGTAGGYVALWSVVGCTALAIVLLASLWNVGPKG